MADIVWFSDLKKDNIAIAGGKGANLGELAAMDLPVPPGFVVSADSYKKFLEGADITPDMKELLGEMDVNNTEELNLVSKTIKNMILGSKMPEQLQKEILEAYAELSKGTIVIAGSDSGRGEFVAVRSSATAEDLPGASFAGQQKTFLNIRGPERLIQAVKECWASLFEARAIFYRESKGFEHEGVLMSVIIQKMVDSEKSGVMFTADPVTSDRSKMTIEAAWGLGEAVVGGEVTPDHYNVDKATLTIEDKRVNTKNFMYSRNIGTGETEKIELDDATANRQVLADDETKHLAEFGKRIEDHYGSPQDIEWAIDEGQIYILQSRSITTLKPMEAAAPQEQPLMEAAPVAPEQQTAAVEPAVVVQEPVEVNTTPPSMNEMEKVAETMDQPVVAAPAVQAAVVTTPELLAPTTSGVTPATMEPIVKGFGASPGIGVGKVKLIYALSDLEKIQKGDILVTKMTTPDMVPAMEKATAIVTDEGGVTCFDGETRVLTDLGFMTMKQAHEKIQRKANVKILCMDKKKMKADWKPILGSMQRTANRITVSVSQRGSVEDNTLTLTPDHKMLTLKNRKLVKKPIQEILNDQESVCLVDYVPPVLGHLETGKKLAYLTGAIMTDGNITLSKQRGRVTFTQKETPEKEEFIQQVNQYFTELFKDQMKPYPKSGVSTIRGEQFYGEATDFISFKQVGAQALLQTQKLMLPWLLNAPPELAAVFLAGIVDGDGTYQNIGGGRIQIYCGKTEVLEAVVIAALRLGILPVVTRNRTIHNVQLVEGLDKILQHTKRVKGTPTEKKLGTKLFSARQILGDIVSNANIGGRIKPYVEKNLLIDAHKLDRLMPRLTSKEQGELQKVINSDLRMYRVQEVGEKTQDLVYNIEVDNHNNYVVFTKRYTPVLVNNCHAAIVSRELGIPCIVGAGNATQILKEGQEVTVDSNTGEIRAGLEEVKEEEKIVLTAEDVPDTKTKIYVNVGVPSRAAEFAKLPVDGVGLMREEFIFASKIGEHPLAMMARGEHQKFIDLLAEGIAEVARAFNPRPVILRLSDFKTNEYKSLKGGEQYEGEESNPMLGWRGCSRYTSEKYKEAFRLELKAVKKVRDELGLKNVNVMLPFVRKVEDVTQVTALMKEEGLERGPDLKLLMMAEVPSNIFLADEFSKHVDGFSIGSNDLTQLIMGADRDSELLAQLGYFDERDPAVTRAISHLIKVAHENGCTVGICGQGPSNYPDFAQFLVEEGIDSISVNADVAIKTRKIIAAEEAKIATEVKEEVKELGAIENELHIRQV